ncbi:MAG: hypothetical protein KGJ37_03860 [Verrucomicrobiota bacterium]|nr:hypothetical protein [Verrucomicrobiota bacterium]
MPILIFDGSEEPLDSWEFAHYLYLLKATYSRALDIAPSDEHQIIESFERYAEAFRRGLPEDETEQTVAEFFSRDDEQLELRLSQISKCSPLEIHAFCVVSALTLAVIFSGGKVDLKGLKFQLPPLGVGIRSLRDALRMRPVQRKRKIR